MIEKIFLFAPTWDGHKIPSIHNKTAKYGISIAFKKLGDLGEPGGGNVFSSFQGNEKRLCPIPQAIEKVIPHFPNSSRKKIQWGIGNSNPLGRP